MRLFKYISIFAIILIAALFIRNNSSRYQVIKGEIYGTYYKIKIKTKDDISTLREEVKASLEDVNKKMSVFDKDSEINRINNAPAGEWIKISPEMSYILRTSQLINTQSSGMFDPTVGKLVELWGFGINKEHKIPNQEEINKVMEFTGINKLEFSDDYSMVKKQHKDTYINLSAIAKGYAVDKTAQTLLKHWYKNFVIDIGGEVRASGKRDEQLDGWAIGIAAPSSENPKNVLVVSIKDFSVATSGDYRNFFTEDEKIYSHTISPKTGYPVENNTASVTVFHKDCMFADAYATALMALGEKKGMQLAEKLKLSAVFMVRKSDNSVEMLFSKEAKNIIGG